MFALNGLAYAALSAGVFLRDRWRPLAGVLLAATLLAYLFYLATGQEDIDTVGVVAYAIALGTLGLVWLGEQSSRCERLQQYRGCEQPSADVACPLPDALCEAAFAKE